MKARARWVMRRRGRRRRANGGRYGVDLTRRSRRGGGRASVARVEGAERGVEGYFVIRFAALDRRAGVARAGGVRESERSDDRIDGWEDVGRARIRAPRVRVE